MYVGNLSPGERLAYEFGGTSEKLYQIIRLIHEEGNETMVYTSDLCRILDIEKPKKRETETEKDSENDLPL